MKCYAIMLGPLWLGVVTADNCIGFGAALWPFKPQLQIALAAPCGLPLILVSVDGGAK